MRDINYDKMSEKELDKHLLILDVELKCEDLKSKKSILNKATAIAAILSLVIGGLAGFQGKNLQNEKLRNEVKDLKTEKETLVNNIDMEKITLASIFANENSLTAKNNFIKNENTAIKLETSKRNEKLLEINGEIETSQTILKNLKIEAANLTAGIKRLENKYRKLEHKKANKKINKDNLLSGQKPPTE